MKQVIVSIYSKAMQNFNINFPQCRPALLCSCRLEKFLPLAILLIGQQKSQLDNDALTTATACCVSCHLSRSPSCCLFHSAACRLFLCLWQLLSYACLFSTTSFCQFVCIASFEFIAATHSYFLLHVYLSQTFSIRF